MRKLGPQFHPISLTCGRCHSHLKLSVELMEFLVETENEAEVESEFDRAIKEALAGNHKRTHFSPMAIYPIAIDENEGSLALLGWCPICKEVRLASITPVELSALIADIRRSDAKGSEGPNESSHDS